MTAPAIAWLESRYEAISRALSKVRLGEPLSDAERDALREARAVSDPMPPRPSVPLWAHTDLSWHWRPGEKPGPLDGRAHP